MRKFYRAQKFVFLVITNIFIYFKINTVAYTHCNCNRSFQVIFLETPGNKGNFLNLQQPIITVLEPQARTPNPVSKGHFRVTANHKIKMAHLAAISLHSSGTTGTSVQLLPPPTHQSSQTMLAVNVVLHNHGVNIGLQQKRKIIKFKYMFILNLILKAPIRIHPFN